MELVEGANRRWVRIVAPPALFVLAFTVRALPFQAVLNIRNYTKKRL